MIYTWENGYLNDNHVHMSFFICHQFLAIYNSSHFPDKKLMFF